MIAGFLEILGTVNDEFEDLMVHVRKHMGEEVEEMSREIVSDLESEVRELDDYAARLELALAMEEDD